MPKSAITKKETWASQAYKVLSDVELLISVNEPINDGSPMHQTVKKLLGKAPNKVVLK